LTLKSPCHASVCSNSLSRAVSCHTLWNRMKDFRHVLNQSNSDPSTSSWPVRCMFGTRYALPIEFQFHWATIIEKRFWYFFMLTMLSVNFGSFQLNSIYRVLHKSTVIQFYGKIHGHMNHNWHPFLIQPMRD
jgi:hypothetical protein